MDERKIGETKYYETADGKWSQVGCAKKDVPKPEEHEVSQGMVATWVSEDEREAWMYGTPDDRWQVIMLLVAERGG